MVNVKPVQVGRNTRMSFARIDEVLGMPNLIEVQKNSYAWFLDKGLKEVFKDVSGITDYTGNLVLDFVDYKLSQNKDKEVHVLIDSLGGDVGTALSICNAFRNHGNVTVHFAGLNASAATIASLGAKKICIDENAMYLVHKVSTLVASWASMNADQLAAYIENLDKEKKNLEKFDLNIASMYAAKCKKEKTDLLALMKEGGWLTAAEAKEWGFVDEISIVENAKEPKLTAAMAA